MFEAGGAEARMITAAERDTFDSHSTRSMSSSESLGPARMRHQGSPIPPARNMSTKSHSFVLITKKSSKIRPLHSTSGHNYGAEDEDEIELSLLGD